MTEEQQGSVYLADVTAQPAPDAPPATWDEIYKSPRFKELVKSAKDAQAALEAQRIAQADAEQAKLKEQQRWQELYEAEQRKYEAEQRKAQELADQLTASEAAAVRLAKRTAVTDAARQHEPPFIAEAVQDLLVLVDLDGLPDGDDLAKAAATAVKGIAQSKPWLLQAARTDPGSPPGRKPAGAPKPTGTGRPMGI